MFMSVCLKVKLVGRIMPEFEFNLKVLKLRQTNKQTNKQTERTLAGTPQQLWPITAGPEI